jgi:hypothetical protein
MTSQPLETRESHPGVERAAPLRRALEVCEDKADESPMIQAPKNGN